jgi:predicted ABC-type transport system involved in lysophospholipase L1 biosynthesis ATPase subunit
MALTLKIPPLPQATVALVGPAGAGSITFAQYLIALDATVRALAAGNVGTLVQAANDAAAAAAGVQVGFLYLNGSQLNVRVS